MKYELVSLSVVIQGKKFTKENESNLDSSKITGKDLDSAYKAGFIKPKGTKAKNPEEVKAQYLSEIGKKADEAAKLKAEEDKEKATK